MVVLVVVCTSVFLFGWVIARIVAQAMDDLEERYGVRGLGDLGDALRSLDRRATWVIGCSLGASFALLLLAFGARASACVAFSCLAPGFPAWARHRQGTWRATIEAQLVDSLQGLAAALRAGFSLPHAMEHLGNETHLPLRREWAVVLREMKFGLSVDEALEGLARRSGSRDVDLMVTSVAVARQLGGNLAEVLDTIASTTRERMRIEGKIRAATAQGRMQAWIIAVIPLLLGVAMAWMRPDLILPMARHPIGWILCGVVLCLELLGLLLIRRIVQIRV